MKKYKEKHVHIATCYQQIKIRRTSWAWLSHIAVGCLPAPSTYHRIRLLSRGEVTSLIGSLDFRGPRKSNKKKSDPSVESQGIPGFLGVWAKEFKKKTVIQMWLMAFRVEQHFPEFGSFKGRIFFRRDPWNFTNRKNGSQKENPSEKKTWSLGFFRFSIMCFSDTVALFCWDSLQKTCHDPPTISSSTAIASFWFKRRPQGPCVWRQCWWKLSSATQTALWLAGNHGAPEIVPQSRTPSQQLPYYLPLSEVLQLNYHQHPELSQAQMEVWYFIHHISTQMKRVLPEDRLLGQSQVREGNLHAKLIQIGCW